MELRVTRGIFGLVGLKIDEMATKCLRSLGPNYSNTSTSPEHYQIVLLTKTELQQLDHNQVSNLQANCRRVYALGVGGDRDKGILFVVIIWAAGQQIRKQLGLPPKSFHISLLTEDDGDMDKGVDSLLPGHFPASPPPDLLDHLTFTLLAHGQYRRALPFCVQLIQASPDSYKGFLRYADTTLRVQEYKQSMLAYACAFQRTEEPKVHEYCIKKIVECSRFTEWGGIFTDEEMTGMPTTIQPLLLTPWSMDLRARLSDLTTVPTLRLESRERLHLHNSHALLHTLPRFFRWLVPFHLAIMSTPRDEVDIAILASSHISIRHILTLTEETPLPKVWFAGKNIKHTYLPIPNYHPPTIEQMDLIMRLFENEDQLPLLIHCGGGKGRAGTVAACYLAAYGFSKPRDDIIQPTMSANDAINILRAIRPGSIETPQQEAFVSKWCSTIWKRQCVVLPLLPEPPPCPLSVEGELEPENDLFILVGLPGSGKSWFSRALVARNAKGWTHICQDDSGSRSFSETEIGRASGRVLLDRCNTALDERKTWLKLAPWVVSPGLTTIRICVFHVRRTGLTTLRYHLVDESAMPYSRCGKSSFSQLYKMALRLLSSFALLQHPGSWCFCFRHLSSCTSIHAPLILSIWVLRLRMTLYQAPCLGFLSMLMLLSQRRCNINPFFPAFD
jgi:atypical dual specificity phosphatase